MTKFKKLLLHLIPSHPFSTKHFYIINFFLRAKLISDDYNYQTSLFKNK